MGTHREERRPIEGRSGSNSDIEIGRPGKRPSVLPAPGSRPAYFTAATGTKVPQGHTLTLCWPANSLPACRPLTARECLWTHPPAQAGGSEAITGPRSAFAHKAAEATATTATDASEATAGVSGMRTHLWHSRRHRAMGRRCLLALAGLQLRTWGAHPQTPRFPAWEGTPARVDREGEKGTGDPFP